MGNAGPDDKASAPVGGDSDRRQKMTTTSERSTGFMQSLRNNPATEKLAGEAKQLLFAQGSKLAGKISDSASSATDKLDDIAESGSLGPIGESAKRLVQGDSPVKAAMGGVVANVKEKVKGAFGKGKGSGQAKMMNIQEQVDIGVPVSTAYDQWTQFKDFSRFMKGVESVEQTSETETNWRAKVFKSRRTWKATITEQIPDRRVAWTSEGAKGSTKGVVTFHPLADDLTRVLLSLEYYPSGLMEKTGNLWRAPGRRTRLDLKNYRRFIMMEQEATGSWRGEIQDGQVVRQPEDEDQQGDEDRSADQDRGQQGDRRGGQDRDTSSGESHDRSEEDDSEDEYDDEPRDESEDQSDDDYEDDYEDDQSDEDDQPDEEEDQQPRRRGKQRSNA
jgi:uncharacterized membrane protein